MARNVFPNGIELTDLDGGLLVRQHCEAYVAQAWQLTSATRELVRAALAADLVWMIRAGHPRQSSRWPDGKGCVHLSFSPSAEDHWSVAIDTFDPATGDYRHAVFNGKYLFQFEERGIPFLFEGRNRTAKHLVVRREHVLRTIQAPKGFDHSVLRLGRTRDRSNGFALEDDIQAALLAQWASSPFHAFTVEREEFPVDGGLTSRRIDILARSPGSRNYLIVEIKRAEAPLETIDQLKGYIHTVAARPDLRAKAVRGAIVAERVPPQLRRSAKAEGIMAYEIKFPFSFERVA